MARDEPVEVHLEKGAKRVFASATAWPGWARGGRSEEEALAALAGYAPRYARVVRRAKVPFAATPDSPFEVTERLRGGAGTDFGVPGSAPAADDEPLPAAELSRQLALLEAAWKVLDAAARAAHGKALRKGPRGGGRDLAKMANHVLEAQESYLVSLGRRRPKAASDAERERLIRAACLETVAARARGEPYPDPSQTRQPWSPRYFVRRSAWHALDHAWEIEDRAEG